jgi:hypothetical protein
MPRQYPRLLPLTMLWANHKWAGEGQSGLGGIEVSFYIGVAAAVIFGP